MRIVVDTNTLVSAFLFIDSIPGKCIHGHTGKFNLLASQPTKEEFLKVIDYPKFDKYISSEVRQQAREYFLRSLVLINVTTRCFDCRDAHDNMFLELAIDGEADLIVSGDKDLLILHPYKNIPIITPRDFLEVLSKF